MKALPTITTQRGYRIRPDGWEEHDRWQVFGIDPDGTRWCLAALTSSELAEDIAAEVRASPIDGQGLAREPYVDVVVKHVVNVTWPGQNFYPRKGRK